MARLPAGPHQLHMTLVASGVATFSVDLSLDSGERLIDETFVLPRTAESWLVDFVVPEDCGLVFFKLRQETGICSRIYDLSIDPEA